MADDLVLLIDDQDDITLETDNNDDLILETTSGIGGTTDYNVLKNKPQINGITLEGNKLLADLFSDGLILDGGDAEGAI